MNSRRKADRLIRRFWAWWTKDHLETYNRINERHGWSRVDVPKAWYR